MKKTSTLKKSKISGNPTELRRRAEAQFEQQRAKQDRKQTDADTQQLLHELQVHQIELEMQNAELRETRDTIDVLLARYTDLYDFAPIGYFSLDEKGLIMEVNLRGASMLGVERSQLINRRLELFVPPANRAMFQDFLGNVFAGDERQIWDGSLQKGDGVSFRADFKATPAATLRENRKWCRVAVLVLSEEAQRRIEVLSTNNRELNREIARRKTVEEALQKSEQHQAKMFEQLRYLSHQILHTQEEERKRISRELHDKIAQSLVGINVHLEALTHKAGDNPKNLKRNIVETQRVVEKLVDIVHQFALELRPPVLDDLGLIPALHAFMKSFATRTGVRSRLTAFAAVEQLDAETRTVLFRVAQEALINVDRHAKASRVEVSIRKLPECVCMEIKDDGKSFEVQSVMPVGGSKRLGILGMRERLEMIGGRFDIESAPGKGTTVIARIPLGTALVVVENQSVKTTDTERANL